MSIILLCAGIVSGSIGVLVFVPASLAAAAVLISTPFVLRLVDDMLVDKWSQVTSTFLLMTTYISASIWAIDLYLDITSFRYMLEMGLIVTGAGFIQLAWIFLIGINQEAEDDFPERLCRPLPERAPAGKRDTRNYQ